MSNFIKKIKRSFLDRKNLKKYLLYAIGEILLVMIGILLAIQVNNWNNAKTDRKAEMEFYQNFKRQIAEDNRIIKGTMDYNQNYSNQYLNAVQIIENNDYSNLDTLGYIALNLMKYSDFDRPSNIYESIANSGELKLLKNNNIKERIQLLEETYIYFNRMENIHYDLVMSISPELAKVIKFSNRSVQQKEQLYNYKFQNIFITALNLTTEKDEIYNRAIKEIMEITELINQELEIR